MTLQSLGWSSFFASEVRGGEPHPCRVISQGRSACLVHDGSHEAFATPRGRLQHQAEFPPVVGDWVLATPTGERTFVIEGILRRRTAIIRKQAGSQLHAQVLAANVDRVLLVTSMNQDFSIRRLERYLTLIWESGATPIIALTKADLAEDADRFLREAEKCALGFPVVSVSSVSGEGVDELQSLLVPEETIVLLGSSGVGKSTLINVLSGEHIRDTRGIREKDDTGRHATSDRHLFVLPCGTLVIDTPGLREVQLWAYETAVARTFPEIADLAIHCRFRDCQHQSEPGCAVLAAVEDGQVDSGRLDSFHRLNRELEHLHREVDPLSALQHKRRLKETHRAYRERKRYRNKP
jgi:ribosome biogenesis GTPase / thiamine phosphate phosphatase